MEEKDLLLENAENQADAMAENEELHENLTEEATAEELAEETVQETVAENQATEENAEETTAEENTAEEATAEETTVEEATAEETEDTSAQENEEGADDDEAEDETDEDETEVAVEAEEEKKKEPFKLTLPANFEELQEKMCTKRGRKLIYKPNEVIYEGSFKVLGTDKKNEEGIRIKDIVDAEIKEGLKQGYLDKFDGLKASEIKEEYENDIVYELADQEFRKMGIIVENGKIKVYVYDWDRKGFHHIGRIDEVDAQESIKYFEDKENYSFDICGIITGGKGKRVIKDESGKIKIVKEKGDPIGVELDITVIKRKD